MLSISESKQKELSEKLFEAIRAQNMDAYIDEIVKTGEMFIPETLPTLRMKISEELLVWNKNFFEIPSSSRFLTGLTLYYYFLYHADKVPVEVVEMALKSDAGFTQAVSIMMIITKDNSTDVMWAQKRFGDAMKDSPSN